MRQLLRCIFIFSLFQATGWVYAQIPTLPAGTSVPDEDPSQSSKSPSSQAAVLASKAEDAIMRSDYGKALPLLNDALAKEPAGTKASARYLFDRGYVEQAQNHLDTAEKDFRKANAANPQQFESHAALGSLLAAQDHWKQSRHELELAAALQPASGDPRQAIAAVARTLARVDAQLHDPAGASDALIAALKLSPEQLDDTLLAARLAEEQGEQDGAVSEYKKALMQDPKSIEAEEGVARILIRQGKFAEAEPYLQQALQQEPNDPTLLAQSATALAGQGKNQAALAQLETLHRQNPNQPAVTRMLADLYSSTGEAAKADPLYRQLIAASPNDPDLLTTSGENFIREQKWSQAVETLQHSLDIQPKQEDAWGSLAFAASQNQQYILVLSALDQRAQYLPESPATLFLRATALDHLHKTREAVPYYQKFLAAANGQFPDEEAQTRQRLRALRK